MRLLVILIPLFLSCHVRGQQQGPDVVNPGDGSGGEVQASEETERDDPIGWVLWENEASSEPKFVPTTPFTHAAIGAASGPKIYVIRKNESTTRDNFISFLTNVSSLLSSSSALFLPPLQGYFPHEKFEDQWCGDSACSTYYECRAIYGPVFSCLRNANYLKAKNGGASDQEAFSFLYDYHPVLCNDSQVAGLRARCPVLIAEGKNGGFIDPFDEPNSENSVPQRGSVNESSFSGEGQDHVPNAPSIVSYGSPATIDVQNPGNTSLSAKEYYLLSVPNWHDAHTDENVQAIIEGGGDTDGLWWDALNFTTDGFVYTLQEALLNEKRLNCSPATPGCNQGLINCADVGARNIPNFEGTIYSRWGFFVLSALQNIALRLQTQFQAINIATVNSTLKVFDIDGYYPIPGKQLGLKDIFSGLGVVFGVLSGFTPVLGPGLGQAGTMLGAVGYYLEKSIKPIATGSATQANFANVISSIYTQLLGGTEQFAIDLFNGKSIEDRNITDMMMNGTWVNRNAFQSLTDASGKMSREIISRSLNALWKISPRNKMWVLFVDLQDDPANPQKCIIDDTGPAESKWCADGGVYYTYNFIEENGNGYVWRPWGPWVNGTASDLGLDLKVRSKPLQILHALLHDGVVYSIHTLSG